MTEAVLFDLDGTLIDSDAAIVWCVNELLSRHGHTRVEPDRIIPLIGVGLTPLLAEFLDRPESYVLEYRSLYKQGFAERTIVYDGAIAMLDVFRTRGTKVAIVTNRNAELASDIIKAKGLSNSFDAVVGENGSILLKPNPEMIIEACRLLDADPRKSAMVGDTVIDIRAGQAAGCRTVFFTRGSDISVDGADYTISSLSELPGLL